MAVKIIQVGLGQIGIMVIQEIFRKRGLKLVGAVDSAPHLKGKKLSELVKSTNAEDFKIMSDIKEAPVSEADMAILTTVSSFEKIAPLLKEIIKQRMNVLSTCEEMVFPWNSNPELTRSIDEMARSAGVSVLSVGVNPGFVMDFLPLVFTGPCKNIEKIEIYRIMDASTRRLAFQKKIGAGLSPEEYYRMRDEGKIRHVGLKESAGMIAHGVGWKLNRFEELVEPIVAEEDIEAGALPVKKGFVAGTLQKARGITDDGQERIYMEMRMSIGQPDPRDTVKITGEPVIESTVSGGLHGDIATTALVINSIKRIVEAPPGFYTPLDLPVATFRPAFD